MNEIVPNHCLLMFVYCGTKFMCSILIAFITWIFNERCESTYIFVHLVLSIKRNKTFMCLSISNLVLLFLCARLYLPNPFIYGHTHSQTKNTSMDRVPLWYNTLILCTQSPQYIQPFTQMLNTYLDSWKMDPRRLNS